MVVVCSFIRRRQLLTVVCPSSLSLCPKGGNVGFVYFCLKVYFKILSHSCVCVCLRLNQHRLDILESRYRAKQIQSGFRFGFYTSIVCWLFKANCRHCGYAGEFMCVCECVYHCFDVCLDYIWSIQRHTSICIATHTETPSLTHIDPIKMFYFWLIFRYSQNISYGFFFFFLVRNNNNKNSLDTTYEVRFGGFVFRSYPPLSPLALPL